MNRLTLKRRIKKVKEVSQYVNCIKCAKCKNVGMKEVITVSIIGPSLRRDFDGFACYAYIIRNKKGHLLHEACGLAEKPKIQSSSGNIASYTALIRALEWLISHGYQKDIITIKSKSKPLVSQLDKVYQSPHQINTINNVPKSLVSLYIKATELISRFYKLSFELMDSSRRKGNNGYDEGDTAAEDMDSKEIEELLVLAYVEAKEKILRPDCSSNSTGGLIELDSPFVTAAQMINLRQKQV